MKLESSDPDWNQRFTVQAGWTKPLRDFLIKQTGIQHSSRILEVGSGTGVILRDINEQVGCQAIGIDFEVDRLMDNKNINPDQVISCANVYSLPFPDLTFDFVISHYFFLWLDDPIQALAEVKRVLRSGGSILVFAEPDYAARVEYPDQFKQLTALQTDSLISQGINPVAGRVLPTNLSSAGFMDIQYGVPGFQIPARQLSSDWKSEWEMLHYDLAGRIALSELEQYKTIDKDARLAGSRVSWVPTFYAIGRKN